MTDFQRFWKTGLTGESRMAFKKKKKKIERKSTDWQTQPHFVFLIVNRKKVMEYWELRYSLVSSKI